MANYSPFLGKMLFVFGIMHNFLYNMIVHVSLQTLSKYIVWLFSQAKLDCGILLLVLRGILEITKLAENTMHGSEIPPMVP